MSSAVSRRAGPLVDIGVVDLGVGLVRDDDDSCTSCLIPPVRAGRFGLTLLELTATGDAEVDGELRTARAARVLAAVLDLQDTDPPSDTYGIWSYWTEESLTEMTPPDWNWAEFLGELVALILLRHESRLAQSCSDAHAPRCCTPRVPSSGAISTWTTRTSRQTILGFWQGPGDDPTGIETPARSVEV